MFPLYFGSRRARPRRRIVTFGGLVHTAPHFQGKIPQKKPYFGGVNRQFQA